MNRLSAFAALLSAAGLACADSLSISADRTNALYACGEQATFTVSAYGKGRELLKSGTLKIALAPYTTQTVRRVAIDLAKANPATVTGTLAEPGFLLCEASLVSGTNKLSAKWGVGFSPEKIVPGSARPADFDAWWDAQMAKLEKEVPLDPQVRPVENWKHAAFDAYRVSFATFGGKRVYGFLTVPKSGKPPYRVDVNVPGAGPGVTGASLHAGTICLTMNVHPYEMPRTLAAARKLYDEQDKVLNARWHAGRYCRSGITDGRESYFYYPIILGINRAVNWVAARPDADPARFTYGGTSQGGGFGYYLCGLNRHFTKASMEVTALTDLSGYLKGRTSGWPKLVESVPADGRAAAAKWAPYFDAAHFAPRITCPVRAAVGFIDQTCPPCAVYAAYNSLRVQDKQIINGLGMPHSVFGWIYQRHGEWAAAK